MRRAPRLSVPWLLRPRNRAAAATCGRGGCELPAILRLAASDFLRPAKQKTLRFLQQNRCEPACGHRGHFDFEMRFFVPLSAESSLINLETSRLLN